MGHPIRRAPVIRPHHLASTRSRCARRHRLTREGLMDSDRSLASRAARPRLEGLADPRGGVRLAQGCSGVRLGRWPAWKRRWLYADPRQYWTLRGGDDYFREQEGQPARSATHGVDRRSAGRATSPARSSRSAAATASCSASCGGGSTSRWSASTSARPNWSRPAATSGPATGSSCSSAAASNSRSPTVRSTWS